MSMRKRSYAIQAALALLEKSPPATCAEIKIKRDLLNTVLLSVIDIAAKRAVAVRRLQGVDSRWCTINRNLFALCSRIRMHVKKTFRALRHNDLRISFGQGVAAAPTKHALVLDFAKLISRSAAKYPDELSRARVKPISLRRLDCLIDQSVVVKKQRVLRKQQLQRLERDLAEQVWWLNEARKSLKSMLKQVAQQPKACKK